MRPDVWEAGVTTPRGPISAGPGRICCRLVRRRSHWPLRGPDRYPGMAGVSRRSSSLLQQPGREYGGVVRPLPSDRNRTNFQDQDRETGVRSPEPGRP